MHRCDREKAAVAGLSERLPGIPGEQKGTGQQDREQRVPALVRELVDRCDMLEAGTRDDRVETPEALDRCLDGGQVALAGSQVGLERLARTVPVGPQVDRQDLVAVALEPLGDRAADAAAGARDERLHGSTRYRVDSTACRASRPYGIWR